MYDETAIYWVHNLASDKKLACVTDDWVVFYSKKFDVYFFYYLKFDGFSNKKCMDSLKEVVDKNKYTHLILSYDSGRMVDDFESNSSIEKFDYSLLNFNSEILYENNIKNIWDCKKVKYFFSCTNMIRRDTNGKEYSSIWQDENTNKFILDYKVKFFSH